MADVSAGEFTSAMGKVLLRGAWTAKHGFAAMCLNHWRHGWVKGCGMDWLPVFFLFSFFFFFFLFMSII
jgi:hypothetical protein